MGYRVSQARPRAGENKRAPSRTPFRWKPAEAARALGISRATLYRRVHEHRIEMPRMKL
ncbi:helix-turn-helix domain-containing protein [Pseudomonas juntendi]